MIKLGLSGPEQKAYHEALGQSRQMKIRVRMLDRDEAVIGELTADAGMVDGFVQVDVEADIKRRLDMTLTDPAGKIVLDPNSPRTSTLFADRFIAVERWDWVASLSKYVQAPVFWGPVSRFERRGEEVIVEALGKEALGLDPFLLWRVISVQEGTLVTTAIKRVMNAIGERRYSLMESSRKLKRDHSLGIHTEPWRAIQAWARSVSRQLFYDGAGRLKMREAPQDPVWTFATGEDGNILSRPGIAYDWIGGNLANVVEVIGAIPKGQKHAIRKTAKAEATHPLSAQSLARNGSPRWIVHTIEDPNITRGSDAQDMADRVLSSRLVAGLDADFDALPVPHLEESDRILIDDDGEKFAHTLRRFTIPLSADEAMVVGAFRRVKFPKRRKR